MEKEEGWSSDQFCLWARQGPSLGFSLGRERVVTMTGRASPFDRTRCTRRLIGVQRAPHVIGHIRSHVIGRATASALRHATKPHQSMLTRRSGLGDPRTRQSGALRVLLFWTQVNYPDALVRPDQCLVTNPRRTAPLPSTWADRTRRSTLDRVRSSVWLEFF
jgi:hypothetical protein